MSVSFEIKNQRAKKRFAKIQDKLKKPGSYMSVAAGMAYKDVIDHFERSKAPIGSWKPLKHRKGKPLLDTGTLRSSVNFKSTKDAAIVFTRLKYAKTHQWGARKGQYGKTKTGVPIPWGRIPAKFMWLSGKMKKKIAVIFKGFIMK